MSGNHIATRTLSCGMPLVTERMPGMKSAALCWLLPCGNAHDPADREGMSAMWSELLVRGAGTHTSREHADAVDRLGASRSTANATFSMAISATMLGSRLSEVLPLVIDMGLAPRFDADGIEPARDLCLQAIESLKDDPQERAILAARKRHFPDPLGRSGLGTEEGLTALTRDELAARWRQLARPGGSYLAAAGDIDDQALASELERLLLGWSGAASEPAIGPTPTRGYAHEEDGTNQVQIVVVHDAPADGPDAQGNESTPALLERIAISVLSGGMSGRLFTEVREKRGLCYSVSAGYRGDKTFGAITAYVGTTPERAQDSLAVLRAELERITTPAGKITSEEFQRAIVGMKSGLVFSGESTSARAGALAGDMRRLGRPRSLEEIARRLDEVTLDQLNAYLATRKLGQPTIQTVGPKALNI